MRLALALDLSPCEAAPVRIAVTGGAGQLGSLDSVRTSTTGCWVKDGE
ncbi:MAG: hypothetical protein AABZ30_11355 [Myxococcota bacterium]